MRSRLAGVFMSCAILWGCAATPDLALIEGRVGSNAIVGAHPSLPRPRTGDRFTYDQGRSEVVTAVAGGYVEMERGSIWTRSSLNPFLPPVERRSTRYEIKSVVDGEVDALFPLATGNKASFQETRYSRRLVDGRVRERVRQWHCSVLAKEGIEVPLGRFETFRVRCENPAANAFYRTARAIDSWYAPRIGRVVKERLERFKKPARERVLIGYGSTNSPEPDQEQLAGMQDLFERKSSGETALINKGDGGQNNVRLIRTVKRRDGTYCREAVIEKTVDESGFDRPVRLCRNDQGLWQPANEG